MHPFPPASSLQFLVGKELEQIALGSWQFQFIFDVGSISVEGNFEQVDNQELVRRYNTDEYRLKPPHVHHLLGQKVIDCAAEPFCLTLTFERDTLRIYSEDGPYECGRIYDEADWCLSFDRGGAKEASQANDWVGVACGMTENRGDLKKSAIQVPTPKPT